MNATCSFVLLATALFTALSARAADTPTQPTPGVEMLFSNVIARATSEKKRDVASQYTYTRTKATEELDDKGRVKELQEKTHQFIQINGRPFARLVAVNGKPLAGKELKAEEERERKARESTTAAAPAKPAAKATAPAAPKKDYSLTPEMFERFLFTVTGLEKVNGRDAWAITFAPRSKDLPIKQLKDRVVNKIAGKIWIDSEENELARVEIGLTDSVSLVGGIVGTLRKFDFALQRIRAEGGAWFTGRSDLTVDGREVVLTRRLRFREETSDIKKVPAVESP